MDLTVNHNFSAWFYGAEMFSYNNDDFTPTMEGNMSFNVTQGINDSNWLNGFRFNNAGVLTSEYRGIYKKPVSTSTSCILNISVDDDITLMVMNIENDDDIRFHQKNKPLHEND